MVWCTSPAWRVFKFGEQTEVLAVLFILCSIIRLSVRCLLSSIRFEEIKDLEYDVKGLAANRIT